MSNIARTYEDISKNTYQKTLNIIGEPTIY